MSVYPLVGWPAAIVRRAKTTEPIEMPCGLWIRVGPRYHILDGGPDAPCRGAILRGKRYLHGKWLAERARSTILLQRNRSFGEMLDQVRFSCRRLCIKAREYDVHMP